MFVLAISQPPWSQGLSSQIPGSRQDFLLSFLVPSKQVTVKKWDKLGVFERLVFFLPASRKNPWFDICRIRDGQYHVFACIFRNYSNDGRTTVASLPCPVSRARLANGAQVFERPLLWYMKVVWVEDRLGLESQVQDGNEQTTVAKLEIWWFSWLNQQHRNIWYYCGNDGNIITA